MKIKEISSKVLKNGHQKCANIFHIFIYLTHNFKNLNIDINSSGYLRITDDKCNFNSVPLNLNKTSLYNQPVSFIDYIFKLIFNISEECIQDKLKEIQSTISNKKLSSGEMVKTLVHLNNVLTDINNGSNRS